MYCYQILRDNLLNLLLSHLDAAVSKATENHAANWPYLEACLFAWAAIGESLAEEEECPQLSQFLSKLVTIPYNDNVKVVFFIGRSQWTFRRVLKLERYQIMKLLQYDTYHHS